MKSSKELISNRVSNDTFLHQQNLVRGTISNFRSKRFTQDPIDPLKGLRKSILGNLLKARTSLKETEFLSYLEWQEDTVKKVIKEFNKPVGFDYL